jgi:hypothetical protein
MIRAQISEKHWKMLQDIVAVAVYAAEQLGATKAIEDKLEYALEAVGSQLQKYKITFDRETIRAAIEAAVKENFPGTQKSKKIGIMP